MPAIEAVLTLKRSDGFQRWERLGLDLLDPDRYIWLRGWQTRPDVEVGTVGFIEYVKGPTWAVDKLTRIKT